LSRRITKWRRQQRGWSGRVDVGLDVASCKAMNAEHRLRQRVDMLSGGGADASITVKKSSAKVGAHGKICVDTCLVEVQAKSRKWVGESFGK
jgi:hypothetical protein